MLISSVLLNVSSSDVISYFLRCNTFRLSLSLFRCSTIEQQVPVAGARMFWLDLLHGYGLDRPLLLPDDRCPLLHQ